MTPAAAHAAVRFGLGARPDALIPADPQAWLSSQIRRLPEAPGPTIAEGLRAIADRRKDPRGESYYRVWLEEYRLWATRMLESDEPFADRWVNFWANHLAVSTYSRHIRVIGGHYYRAVLRPHAFGRFEDMLLHAYRHPAMLIYLDQANSVGPDSPTGQRRSAGLNENLARECMELHSVTPAAGYTQADVTSLARILTGWSVDRNPEPNTADCFVFRSSAHEPGEKRLMGRNFPEGEEGGIQALRFLANHPSTHRALAVKLARHFVADEPPPQAVARIEAALRDSGGDLAAAAHAVIAAPEAQAPLRKVRSGQDYAIAVMRALGQNADQAPQLINTMARLNQALWGAPAPIGWPDAASEWAAPEQLMRRVDWATEVASFAASAGMDPAMLGETLLGPLAHAETATAARRAGSAREGILLLLASPEAQRR